MNQIICDICGSEYPETAERCPICNYPRQGDEAQAVSRAETVRTKAKGGHFSKKNVKKRQKAQRSIGVVKKSRSDKPLIVVIILLLIAIMLVSVYIVFRFWGGHSDLQGLIQQKPAVATTAPTIPSTAAPSVPCTGLELAEPSVGLTQIGEHFQLAVKPSPENTTDLVVYASSDESVVTVSETGVVTAMGDGQAQITVTCGDASVSCLVECRFPVETTQPVETTAPQVTEPAQTEPKPTEKPGLVLDPVDVSCFTAGESFTIYPRFGGSSVSRSKVQWTTSDPKIAVVENGVVTAVAKGIATITAKYEGQEAVCTVRCRFENPEPTEEDQDQEQQPQGASWKASHTDVTLSVGESFRLTVKNSAGETADAIWTMSVDGVVAIDGKTITGGAPGVVTLTTTVDGITLTCIVRVK